MTTNETPAPPAASSSHVGGPRAPPTKVVTINDVPSVKIVERLSDILSDSDDDGKAAPVHKGKGKDQQPARSALAGNRPLPKPPALAAAAATVMSSCSSSRTTKPAKTAAPFTTPDFSSAWTASTRILPSLAAVSNTAQFPYDDPDFVPARNPPRNTPFGEEAPHAPPPGVSRGDAWFWSKNVLAKRPDVACNTRNFPYDDDDDE